MGFGAPGSNVRPPSADGRHDVQLLSNLLKRGDFWEPVERVNYSLFVGHGQKIPLRGSKGKRRVATPNRLLKNPLFDEIRLCKDISKNGYFNRLLV